MVAPIVRVEYFYLSIPDEPGEGYRLLNQIAAGGVNLLAFHSVPMGPDKTQLTLFPENPRLMQEVLKKAQIPAEGPHLALLLRGEDRLGALAKIHKQLADANVNVYASMGVAGTAGDYACVVYLRPDQFDRAATLLGV
jgi:hypothetical protein